MAGLLTSLFVFINAKSIVKSWGMKMHTML